jgi:hypothetical protein
MQFSRRLSSFLLLASALGLFGVSTPSHALFKIGVVATGTFSLPNLSPSNGRFALPGGGLLFDVRLGTKMLDLELGALYSSRTFVGNSAEQKMALLNFPVRLNFNMTYWIFISAGGYFNWNIATPTSFPNPIDYGASAGLGFNIPVSSSVAVTLASYFNYSFANIAASGASSLGPHEITMIAGLRIGMIK